VPGALVWGVWTSLSQKNFERFVSLLDSPDRHEEPPYFGWLSSRIPMYPETLNLKTHVHLRPHNARPYVELEPTDHSLAAEQREGMTLARARSIAEAVFHSSAESDR
jgi:hypothetical protein